MVIQILVIGQFNGICQTVYLDGRGSQCVSPVVAAVSHSQYERVERVAVVFVGSKAGCGVFCVVGSRYLSPRLVLVVSYLTDAVAPCHDGVFENRAYIYRTRIYIYIIERTAYQRVPQFGVFIHTGAKACGE